MKTIENPTHVVVFSTENNERMTQTVYGKTDLLNCLRAMMKDGYCSFEISPIKKS
jgi:hypothetical protein